MIIKRNHTRTTLRHVSQCCSLRYSFNFSHKCLELVGPSLRFSSLLQSYASFINFALSLGRRICA